MAGADNWDNYYSLYDKLSAGAGGGLAGCGGTTADTEMIKSSSHNSLGLWGSLVDVEDPKIAFLKYRGENSLLYCASEPTNKVDKLCDKV